MAEIDEEVKRQVLGGLSIGLRLGGAARLAGITPGALRRLRGADALFDRAVRQTIERVKVHHLKRIVDAKEWRAAAFILERRWPGEFGKGSKKASGKKENKTIRMRRIHIDAPRIDTDEHE
jgi:hypothetical protein